MQFPKSPENELAPEQESRRPKSFDESATENKTVTSQASASATRFVAPISDNQTSLRQVRVMSTKFTAPNFENTPLGQDQVRLLLNTNFVAPISDNHTALRQQVSSAPAKILAPTFENQTTLHPVNEGEKVDVNP